MPQEVLHEAGSMRARICAAAFDLFGEKGYDGASMNEVAERVGIAKPSLYNYYRSKEELLLDLVERGMRQWVDFCMAPLAVPASFERQLADHLRLTVEFSSRNPHMVAVFHMATSHVQGELAARVQQRVVEAEAAVHATFNQRIAEAVASGELDPETRTGDLMMFLSVFFHGLLFMQTSCPHQVGPLADRLEPVWRMLYRGVAGRTPREALRS
ncbi:MAG: TetR/AcrR family transcriptional regulator [Thermoanaerobaculia bacterium]|nr:MAG: TetR/AcrR family transcriptional regulator [Thermoanaerobaculia bacterium]